MLGIVRKRLGLSFLGVTRPTEHLLVADIEMRGLSADVSIPDLCFRKATFTTCSIGTLGATTQQGRESDTDVLIRVYRINNLIRVRLRPVERPGVFSLIGGGAEADISSALQSREGVIEFIEDVTGRHDFEFGEMKYLSEWR